jgi:hypothetical protein
MFEFSDLVSGAYLLVFAANCFAADSILASEVSTVSGLVSNGHRNTRRIP